MQQRGLAMCEASHGSEHAHSLSMRWRLAELQELVGRNEEARKSFERWGETGGELAVGAERASAVPLADGHDAGLEKDSPHPPGRAS